MIDGSSSLIFIWYQFFFLINFNESKGKTKLCLGHLRTKHFKTIYEEQIVFMGQTIYSFGKYKFIIYSHNQKNMHSSGVANSTYRTTHAHFYVSVWQRWGSIEKRLFKWSMVKSLVNDLYFGFPLNECLSFVCLDSLMIIK